MCKIEVKCDIWKCHVLLQQALDTYESSLGLLTEVGDRAGQAEVWMGKSATLLLMEQHTQVRGLGGGHALMGNLC